MAANLQGACTITSDTGPFRPVARRNFPSLPPGRAAGDAFVIIQISTITH